jgi:hypothetical protein
MKTDPYESAEYQRFVESMVEHCHCHEGNRPCDGVLAGGLCDGIGEDDYEDEENCDECGYPQSRCDCVP